MFNLNLFQVQIVYELTIISPTTIVVVLVVIVIIGAVIFGFWKKNKAIVFMPPNIPAIPLIACQYCKNPLEKSYNICPNCGKPVISSDNSVICPKCHQHVPYSARFCQQCGFEFGKKI
jgi:RNA polymerase subunit RPABC4/transcription elongation factor Spt4